MADIKLRDGSGIEQTYTNVDYITVPLADGTGTHVFGVADEDLVFTPTSSGFDFPVNDYFMNDPSIVKRIKINPYTDDGVYYCCWLMGSRNVDKLDQLIFDIPDGSGFQSYGLVRADAYNKLPKIKGNNLIPYLGVEVANLGTEGGMRYFSEEDWYEWLSHFDFTTTLVGKYNGKAKFGELRIYNTPTFVFDTTEINKKYCEIWNSRTIPESGRFRLTGSGYSFFDGTHIRNVPIVRNYTNTSEGQPYNYPLYPYGNYPFLTALTFENNGSGEPYEQPNWSFTIDMTYYPRGFSKSYYTNNPYKDTKYYNGKTHPYTTNIFTSDSMTIEEAQARYNELKAENKWYSQAPNQVTYDGTTRYIAELFSRYNHDSAVETINSLPKVKSCTLEFMKYSGALTDGGGINNLTEEEIAVATAKGWTITMS